MRTASSFTDALIGAQASSRVPLIAEVKCRSPKEGDLLKGRDPISLARAMQSGGAACISVVTERNHYGGSLELLSRVVETVSLPVLRKDFIQTERDIRETRSAGASCVLLIACMLDWDQLFRLHDYSRQQGLETLIEVKDRNELKKALELNLDLLGINNRDIQQLETDDGTIAKVVELVKDVPLGIRVISESAVCSPDDVKAVIEAGVFGILVGTAILKSENVEATVRMLANAMAC